MFLVRLAVDKEKEKAKRKEKMRERTGALKHERVLLSSIDVKGCVQAGRESRSRIILLISDLTWKYSLLQDGLKVNTYSHCETYQGSATIKICLKNGDEIADRGLWNSRSLLSPAADVKRRATFLQSVGDSEGRSGSFYRLFDKNTNVKDSDEVVDVG